MGISKMLAFRRYLIFKVRLREFAISWEIRYWLRLVGDEVMI